MGAFSGYRIPYPAVPEVCTQTYEYFPNFSFGFFDGFGEPELRKLLATAQAAGKDKVWVPVERPGSSGIGLPTWYVQALLAHYFGEHRE